MAPTPQHVASDIAKLVLRHHRSTDPTHQATSCQRCLLLLSDAVQPFVAAGRPVDFVLPAFPVKSPNPAKVLGPLPDLAERMALDLLERLCLRIGDLHPAGARILLCSDGRVFSDVVGVSDQAVTAYQRAMESLLAPGSPIRLFCLDDVTEFAHLDHQAMREELVSGYGQPLAEITTGIRAGGPDLPLYRAITRFLFEDRLTPDYQGSRAALQRAARARAYLMIQRSQAWGNLLGDYHPQAVRLSIHPQPCGSEKTAIQLAGSADGWLTPWHGVAVLRDGRLTLLKRSEAERLGARLVSLGGRPDHYVLDQATASDRQRLTGAATR